MRRLLVVIAVTALGLPSGASAECTSALPVADRRAAHHECTGVHPGMGLAVPSKKYGTLNCTAAFAFTDQAGNRYLTFPGSCHLDYSCLEDTAVELLEPFIADLPPLPTCTLPSDSEEEPVYKRNAPVVRDLDGNRVGTIVYAVNKKEIDFALVKVDPAVRLDPRLPLYGGPTSSGTAAGSPEEAYAYSATKYPAPNARTGLLHRVGTRTYFLTDFGVSIGPGSPVVKPAGEAVGYFSFAFTLGYGWEVKPYADAVARAAEKTGLRLRMLTAPLA